MLSRSRNHGDSGPYYVRPYVLHERAEANSGFKTLGYRALNTTRMKRSKAVNNFR